MRAAGPSLILLCLLSACSLGPEYEQPQVQAPAGWEAGDTGAGLWPDPQWWTGFGSTELSAMVAEARTGSQDLQAAIARILQAEAQARVAGAALFPSLSLGGSGTRSTTSGGMNSGARYSYQGTASAAYQLDLFGANRAGAAAGEARLESSRYDGETVAITLNADVASNYFQILALRDRIRLASEQLRTAQSILDLVEQQRRIGTISDLEVAQQRSAIAQQQASVQALRQSERESVNALAVLLGRPPEGFRVQGASLSELRLPAVAAGLPSELLQRRPDIRKAEADLRAGNFDVAGARAARFPSIQLTASGGSASQALSGLFGPGNWITSLAAGLTAPIFQGGQLEAQEDSARARFQELTALYGRAIVSAFRDVENALSATGYYARQYEYSRTAFEQAREAYRLAEVRYRTGTVDFITVLNAQQTVFQTNDSLVQADLARYTALVNLYLALGGGWDGLAPTLPLTAR